jgi:protein SCO1/2
MGKRAIKKLGMKRTPWKPAVPAFVFVTIVCVIAISSLKQPDAPNDVSFELVTQEGHVVTPRSLAGRPFLVVFGYTHCDGACPVTLAKLSQSLSELGTSAQLSIFFITVDPKHDTPSEMTHYLANFDSRIIGLSGSQERLAQIYRTFHIAATKIPEGKDYWIDHDTDVFLSDKRGRFVKKINMKRTPKEIASELQTYL